MASVKKAKPKRNIQNQRIAKDMERWLEANPNATLKRTIRAFDAIADAEFNAVKEPPIKATSKKLVKRI